MSLAPSDTDVAGRGHADDRRAAAQLVVSVSSYVMTAALGIIAAQAAIVTFTLDKKENLFWFFIVLGFAFLLLVTSIVCGGKGMAEIYTRGHGGDWRTRTTGRLFQRQTTLTLLALPLTLGSLLLGDRKSEIKDRAVTPPTPLPASAQLRVQRLPLNTVFVTGEPCTIESGTLERAAVAVTDALLALSATSSVAYVLVVGSADARELLPRARPRLGSNLGLAQLRADCVAAAIRRRLETSLPASQPPEVISLVRGPRHPEPAEWPNDREVQVWAVALEPRAPPRAASTAE